MVRHTQTMILFEHFVWLALKGLTASNYGQVVNETIIYPLSILKTLKATYSHWIILELNAGCPLVLIFLFFLFFHILENTVFISRCLLDIWKILENSWFHIIAFNHGELKTSTNKRKLKPIFSIIRGRFRNPATCKIEFFLTVFNTSNEYRSSQIR